jgi:hypothetical protein
MRCTADAEKPPSIASSGRLKALAVVVAVSVSAPAGKSTATRMNPATTPSMNLIQYDGSWAGSQFRLTMNSCT